MNRFSAVLYCGAALGLGCQAGAQTAPATSTPAANGEIIVKGKRMPTAEAPRSATCEALIRNDPSFRAMIEAATATGTLGPFVYLPTRMPRNPDYSAAPLSPVGSPLPDLGRGRFGVGERNSADEGNRADSTNAENNIPEAGDVAGTIGTAENLTPFEYSDAQARADCRAAFAPGASSIPGDPVGPRRGITQAMAG